MPQTVVLQEFNDMHKLVNIYVLVMH